MTLGPKHLEQLLRDRIELQNLRDRGNELDDGSANDRFVELELAVKVREAAAARGWTDGELDYALLNADRPDAASELATETVVPLANGRALHFPAPPADCTYIRVLDQGIEVAFYSDAEMMQFPTAMMGRLMGSAQGAIETPPAVPAPSPWALRALHMHPESHFLVGFNWFVASENDREYKHDSVFVRTDRPNGGASYDLSILLNERSDLPWTPMHGGVRMPAVATAREAAGAVTAWLATQIDDDDAGEDSTPPRPRG